jgi:hypothetical protein
MLRYQVFSMRRERRAEKRLEVTCETANEACDLARGLLAPGIETEIWDMMACLCRLTPASELWLRQS